MMHLFYLLLLNLCVFSFGGLLAKNKSGSKKGEAIEKVLPGPNMDMAKKIKSPIAPVVVPKGFVSVPGRAVEVACGCDAKGNPTAYMLSADGDIYSYFSSGLETDPWGKVSNKRENGNDIVDFDKVAASSKGDVVAVCSDDGDDLTSKSEVVLFDSEKNVWKSIQGKSANFKVFEVCILDTKNIYAIGTVISDNSSVAELGKKIVQKRAILKPIKLNLAVQEARARDLRERMAEVGNTEPFLKILSAKTGGVGNKIGARGSIDITEKLQEKVKGAVLHVEGKNWVRDFSGKKAINAGGWIAGRKVEVKYTDGSGKVSTITVKEGAVGKSDQTLNIDSRDAKPSADAMQKELAATHKILTALRESISDINDEIQGNVKGMMRLLAKTDPVGIYKYNDATSDWDRMPYTDNVESFAIAMDGTFLAINDAGQIHMYNGDNKWEEVSAVGDIYVGLAVQGKDNFVAIKKDGTAWKWNATTKKFEQMTGSTLKFDPATRSHTTSGDESTPVTGFKKVAINAGGMSFFLSMSGQIFRNEERGIDIKPVTTTQPAVSTVATGVAAPVVDTSKVVTSSRRGFQTRATRTSRKGAVATKSTTSASEVAATDTTADTGAASTTTRKGATRKSVSRSRRGAVATTSTTSAAEVAADASADTTVAPTTSRTATRKSATVTRKSASRSSALKNTSGTTAPATRTTTAASRKSAARRGAQ